MPKQQLRTKRIPSAEEENQAFFQKVYAWMFLGLLLSALAAYSVASVPALTALFLFGPLFFVLLIGELALVFSLVFFMKRVRASTAGLLFILYSLTTGLTLSVIFLVYEISSIALVFIITAGMFGAMSLYGYTTKRDLTSFGSLLFMGLLGIVIAGFINLFFGNPLIDFALSCIGVLIFTGLTAYDTQKIKQMNVLGNEGTEEDTKEAIVGALHLYLDFINLFLDLLRLLGKRKR